MYTLIVRGPDGNESTHPLGVDAGLLVGRDAACDIVLDSDRVSRRHARFYTEGGTLFIEDMESQNGVFVGGARVRATAEIRPGPVIEIGEFQIRVRRAEDARQQAPAGGAPRLRGVGDMAGREVVLGARALVGRESGEVVVANDSVSRRHAELRVAPEGVFVKDLGSSNGTFVNGRQLTPQTEARVRPGDKIRFGETTWELAGSAPAAPVNRRRLLLLAAGAVMIVFFAVMLVLKQRNAPQGDGPRALRSAEDDSAEAVAQAHAAMAADRFEEARRLFAQALDADPFNTEARALLRRATREAEAEKLFKDASAKAGIGQNEEALQLLFRIHQESRFFAKARLKVQETAQSTMRRDQAACREAARARNSARALEACARFLDFRCQTEEDADALKALRAAEAKEKVAVPWQCPARLAPWFSAGTRTGADPAKELASRYPAPAVRDAMAAYVRGELDQARRALAKAKSDQKTAADIVMKLDRIDSRYREGQAAAAIHDLRVVEEALREALELDAQLVPAPLRSYHAQQMQNVLAREFYEAGRTKFERNSHVEAWEDWSRGLSYARTDSNLLDGIGKLERIADELLGGSPGCEAINKALRITRAEPPSPANARARKLAEQQGCQ